MAQKHYEQNGTFHITTNARKRIHWLILLGVPELLIDNLQMTRNLQQAEVLAFCVLPDHMHIVLRPGKKGLSAFMHSFKRNSAKDIAHHLRCAGNRTRAAEIPSVSRTRAAEIPFPNRRQGSVTSPTEATFTGWQRSFHDERIRDEHQLEHALAYVRCNALHHELVTDPTAWPWTSLHFDDMLRRPLCTLPIR